MRSVRPLAALVFLLAISTFFHCSDNPLDETPPEVLQSFRLTVPGSVTIGEPFSITVTAVSSNGTAPYTGFTGVVVLSGSPGNCTPYNLPITNGTGSGDIVLSGSTASQVITATSGNITGSVTINAGFMIALDGDPGDPANENIPEIEFFADGTNYTNDHPDLSGIYISYNTIMLSFNTGTTVAQANTIIAGITGIIVGGITGDDAVAPGVLFLKLTTANHTVLSGVIATLEANPLIQTVVPDVLLGTNAIPRPNDGDPADWTWEAIPDGPNWGLESMRVPQMWNFTDAAEKQRQSLGFYPPTILIVDDGFASNHPDLRLQLRRDNHEASHGTFMTGIIGATYDNGIGIDGVCPSVNMMCQFITAGVSGPSNPLQDRASVGQAIINGTREAIRAYSRVVNMSIGYNWAGASIDSDTDPLAQQICAAQAQLFVNTFHLGTFSFRAPLFVVSGGNDSGQGFGTQDARYNSPMCYAALEMGIESIVVVEAVQPGVSGGVQWWPSSSIGGDVSAPGAGITSTVAGGTNYGSTIEGSSAATAHVSGLAAYLFLANSYLTSVEVRDLIRSNTVPVGGNAAPFVDAWASVVDIDRLRAYEPALRLMCDIDDGSVDGNKRVLYKDRVDYYEEDEDADNGIGDGTIDMSDFRRWRDWYLANRAVDPVELNGGASHSKKDVNDDGTVGTPAEEQVYPRGDFNGDGTIDETAVSYVPGAIDTDASDLDVLRAVFDDPDYDEWDLPGLVESGDLEIHLTSHILSDYGANDATVTLHRDGQALTHTKIITGPDSRAVITAPTVPEGYTVTFDISGTNGSDTYEFGSEIFHFFPGSDVWLEPLGCIQIDPENSYLHVCSVDHSGDALVIDLSGHVNPGDYIMIDQVGSYDAGGGWTGSRLSAVFSSSATLLGPEVLNRVPGAIEAGNDIVTDVTFDCGGEATDIPQDFECRPSAIVKVPPGARYLFIATNDSKYGDNWDADGDFKAQLTRIWVKSLN